MAFVKRGHLYVYEKYKKPDTLHLTGPKYLALLIIVLLFVANDLSEVWFEGCSTNRTSVDVSHSKQFCCISCIYRSAVLDTDSFCCICIVDLSYALTDTFADFLSLLACSSFACSDSQIGS